MFEDVDSYVLAAKRLCKSYELLLRVSVRFGCDTYWPVRPVWRAGLSTVTVILTGPSDQYDVQTLAR